jgi:hypothetical protein
MIKLELEPNAITFIINTLGDLPTKTGAWELVKIIDAQASSQMPNIQPQKPPQ